MAHDLWARPKPRVLVSVFLLGNSHQPPVAIWQYKMSKLSASPSSRLELHIPRLSLTGTYDLGDIMKNLDIIDLKNEQTDLSGITGNAKQKLSKVTVARICYSQTHKQPHKPLPCVDLQDLGPESDNRLMGAQPEMTCPCHTARWLPGKLQPHISPCLWETRGRTGQTGLWAAWN